jgi:hypothetical protein
MKVGADQVTIAPQLLLSVPIVIFVGQPDIIGFWLSETTTLKVHVELFPDPSVTVQRTVVVPALNIKLFKVVKPVAVVAPVNVARIELTVQLSVAVASQAVPTCVNVQTPVLE